MNPMILLLASLSRTLPLAGLIAAHAFLPVDARADGHRGRVRDLEVRGYQAYTNLVFLDPVDPTILQVRTGGEGGFTHLGPIRSGSVDQTDNLVTGALVARYTFEDERGDQFFMDVNVTSGFQPDGRITFSGDSIVTGGTGRFSKVSGTLFADGWARGTDPATGVGIGFVTFTGVLKGVRVDEDKAHEVEQAGTAVLNGPDFVFDGKSELNRGGGRFATHIVSTPGPFHAAFVGVIDGRFVLAWSFDSTWTRRNHGQLNLSGIEFVGFELLPAPDGSPAPDFSKPSHMETFETVLGGTRRYRNARGVGFFSGTIVPTGPTTTAAETSGVTFLSQGCVD